MLQTPPCEQVLTVSRLKNRADFINARKGKKAHETAFVLQLAGDTGRDDLRIGFTVTKKIGNAVVRNRIKRRLREAIRQMALPAKLAGHDAVFIARRDALDIPFADLICDITTAFDTAFQKGFSKKVATGLKPVANEGHTGQNRRRDPTVAIPKTESSQR